MCLMVGTVPDPTGITHDIRTRVGFLLRNDGSVITVPRAGIVMS